MGLLASVHDFAMVITVEPQTFPALKESILSSLGRLAKSLKLSAAPTIGLHTFSIHGQIDALLWSFNLPAITTIHQRIDTGTEAYLLLFAMQHTLPREQSVRTYFAAPGTDALIHCEKNQDWTLLLLSIPRSLFSLLWLNTSQGAGAGQLRQLQEATEFSGTASTAVKNAFFSLKKVADSGVEGAVIEMYATLVVINFIESLQNRHHYERVRVSRHDDLDRIIRLVETRSAAAPPLPVEQMAHEVGMSATKFRQLFKVIYQKPVHDYFVSHRLEWAKELLLQGHSVAQVATMAGFTKANNFTRLFGKHFGDKPSSLYKKQADEL